MANWRVGSKGVPAVGGALASVRPDDLGAIPLKALAERNPKLDLTAVDEVIFGCANQAGEDNRNVARMSLLLAGYPDTVPATTMNRLCGSGMDAIITAARAIKAGEAQIMISGGTESMSRAPFVMQKATTAYSRANEIHDTTIGWRFVNKLMKAQYGVDNMPETAENVATDFNINRADQDQFALRSQQKAGAAQLSGRLAQEIMPGPSLNAKAALSSSQSMNTHVQPPHWRLWKNFALLRRAMALSRQVMRLA